MVYWAWWIGEVWLAGIPSRRRVTRRRAKKLKLRGRRR